MSTGVATLGQEPLLSVSNVVMQFGGILALDDICFDVCRRHILGLIGPNGAGKTTLFNCLSRLYTPSSGDVALEGRSILKLPAHALARNGISRTFQNVALFRHLSVIENILVGAHTRGCGNFASDILRLPGTRRRESELRAKADELLCYFELDRVRDVAAADLPFGTQKRVELARALASEPKLLLLDEPAGGLNHEEVGSLGRTIRRIRDERGVTILLVEHHMGLVMSTADQVVVLNFGRKIAEGTPERVQSDDRVVEAYLGAQP